MSNKLLKVEVLSDSSGNYATNGLLFEDMETANAYGVDLAMRWLAVRDWRVRAATAEEIARGAVYRLVNGSFQRVEEMSSHGS